MGKYLDRSKGASLLDATADAIMRVRRNSEVKAILQEALREQYAIAMHDAANAVDREGIHMVYGRVRAAVSTWLRERAKTAQS